MSLSGNHGYVNVNGARLALVTSWEADIDEGNTFGSPGQDGTDLISVTIVVNANPDSDIALVRGSYVGLELSESGSANFYHKLIECRVTSIRYSGAAVNRIVQITVQLETIRPKEVINVI